MNSEKSKSRLVKPATGPDFKLRQVKFGVSRAYIPEKTSMANLLQYGIGIVRIKLALGFSSSMKWTIEERKMIHHLALVIDPSRDRTTGYS